MQCSDDDFMFLLTKVLKGHMREGEKKLQATENVVTSTRPSMKKQLNQKRLSDLRSMFSFPVYAAKIT